LNGKYGYSPSINRGFQPQTLLGVFGTLDITGDFRNLRHYWGFSKPHALTRVFETPGIN